MRRYALGGALPDYRLDPPEEPRACPCDEEGECPRPYQEGAILIPCEKCKGEGIVPCPEIPEGDDLCPHEECIYKDDDPRQHVCEPVCPACDGEEGEECRCPCHDGPPEPEPRERWDE